MHFVKILKPLGTFTSLPSPTEVHGGDVTDTGDDSNPGGKIKDCG